jgi:predicted O-methyltransferase YrrM
MTQEAWTAIDDYLNGLLVPPDRALDAALHATKAAGMPSINVAPNQGKMLHLLALSIGARSILEIGTLGGYSTIWLARALPPDGRVISLEADAKHAEVARDNLAKAGLAHLVEVRLGRAIDTLPVLQGEGRGPFDLVFIDADKPSTPEYFAWAVRLARRGALIVVDNVIRGGKVVDENSPDANVLGMRRFLAAAAAEPRVTVTAVQTVGSKGHDGFALALVTGDATTT